MEFNFGTLNELKFIVFCEGDGEGDGGLGLAEVLLRKR